MRYRPVQKMGRRRPPTPIFNILIRNAYRPTLFSTCIQSVLSQTYTNYRIIMCYDNNRSLEYLSSLKGYSNIMIFKASKVEKQHPAFYNLYMNELLSKVNSGWIIILDDDNKFDNKHVLTNLASQITSEQDFIFWKVRIGPEITYPKNIYNLELYQFDGGGCCFNSKFKSYGKWYAQYGSDYIYINQILKHNPMFHRKLINNILTRTIHNLPGMKGASEKYNILDFQEFIHKHKLTQVFVSDSLKHLQPRLLSLFNLKEYYNRSLPALFFGIYNKQDFQYIHNHTSLSYLMFGGSDVPNYEKCNPSIIFVAISTDIQTRIKQDSILIKFTLVDKTIFKPYHSQGNKIYIFDGRLKKDSNRITYGATYYDEVVNRLPNHEFMYSSDLNMPYEKMPEIYRQCFIGLRLTSHDGNANTVQELEAMNIPVIHNQSEYGLKWKNIDDIIMHIKHHDFNGTPEPTPEPQLLQLPPPYPDSPPYLDMFQKNDFSQEDLAHINNNISQFVKDIQALLPNKPTIATKILFICGDKPGYGGAATNCYELQTFLKRLGFKTYGFYYPYEPDQPFNKEDHCFMPLNNLDNITQTFNPDIIIVRSMVPTNLTNSKVPIIFIVPGVYTNALSKNYNTLTLEEHAQFVNPVVINLIHISTYTYVNSKHTKEIIIKYHNINPKVIKVFYAPFVPYFNKPIPIDDKPRKYDYGLIVSNFNRQIKNVHKSIEFLKGKEKVILIGKHSSPYKSHGFECVELVEHVQMDTYYKQIKYLVQDSFYESCSNVKIEGLFNGCKMKPVIVVSSTQYAGYGGAATNAYQLIKRIRAHGYKVAGVFFHNNLEVEYDPDAIGGIFLYTYKYNANTVKSDTLAYLHAEPTLCLAKNYLAPQYCKEIFKCFTTYLVSGINHFRLFFPTQSAQEILDESFQLNDEYKFEKEIKTLDMVDLAINNSKISNDIFMKFYPTYKNKIYNGYIDTTVCIHRIPLLEKKYDIIIACSRLIRKNKNNMFLIDLLEQPIFDSFNKIIIGENNEAFKNIPNSTVLNLQSHHNSIHLLNQSKILLFPSLFDSNSNTIREAYYHKCLPLITRNIGFNELFPDYLICDNFTIPEWTNKLKYLLDNYEQIKDTKIDFNTELDINELIV